jgi:hypothetical protein
MSKISEGSRVLGNIRSGQRKFEILIQYIRPPQDTFEFMWLKQELYPLVKILLYEEERAYGMDDLIEDALELLHQNACSETTTVLKQYATLIENELKRLRQNYFTFA